MVFTESVVESVVWMSPAFVVGCAIVVTYSVVAKEVVVTLSVVEDTTPDVNISVDGNFSVVEGKAVVVVKFGKITITLKKWLTGYELRGICIRYVKQNRRPNNMNYNIAFVNSER